MIHDEALFSPGWMVDFSRIGSWRWVRWPDTKDTPFCVPIVYSPLDAYVLWIDEDIKEETQHAMREGKTFPEVQRVIDDFKDGIPQQKHKEEMTQKNLQENTQEGGADNE